MPSWMTFQHGSKMEYKVCWPKFKSIILKVRQILFQSQTYLEMSTCNIFACELRYHTYSSPLLWLWKCNAIIGNLRISIVSTPEDVRFRVGKLGKKSINIHICELCYCELRYHRLFFYPTSANLGCTSLASSLLVFVHAHNQITSTAVLRSISKGTLLQ